MAKFREVLRTKSGESYVALCLLLLTALVGWWPGWPWAEQVLATRAKEALLVGLVMLASILFLFGWLVLARNKLEWEARVQVWRGKRDRLLYCPRCNADKLHVPLRLTPNKTAFKCPKCNVGFNNPDAPPVPSPPPPTPPDLSPNSWMGR